MHPQKIGLITRRCRKSVPSAIQTIRLVKGALFPHPSVCDGYKNVSIAVQAFNDEFAAGFIKEIGGVLG